MTGPDTRCAACGCRYSEHCRICGCLTDKGASDECLCARFVPVIHQCPHCGAMFAMFWMLQNHLLPIPTCKTGPRAAAGKYAEPPSSEPPLREHRNKYVRSR